jgi:hypothetical protein
MPIQHRPIPILPERPRVHPIAGQISRSYPVGRAAFSRACQGENLTLSITTAEPLADAVQASLVTTLNSKGGSEWTEIPFVRTDEHTLTCVVVPMLPGLHSFRAQFSRDGGATWLHDTVPDAWVLIDPPQVDALRLYSMIPTVSGTVADWKADLRRIREMGFNGVHLLPITTMGASESPYAARDLFVIDRGYLVEGVGQDGLLQLEDYVEEAKALGMRLCFDLVLNHIGVDSTMARRAPDWIVPDQNELDGFKRAGYWSGQGWQTWSDLALIDYEHPSEAVRAEIWAYMTDYALFWAKYADYTGGFVRFDNLHGSDSDFIQALTAALHSEFPNVAILAEYFTDERTLLHSGLQWGLNLVLATPWDSKFVPQLREYLQYIYRVSEHIRFFMPITSHDSGTPAQEFGSVQSTIPRYVAAALLGTGATGVAQGVEFGDTERINFIGRKPKMTYPADAMFGPFIGRVNAILADHPAFRRGDNCLFVDNGHAAIIAAFRRDIGTDSAPEWDNAAMRSSPGSRAPKASSSLVPAAPEDTAGFLVLCNFDIGGTQSITIDLTTLLQTDGPFECVELISGVTHLFPNARLDIELAPCSAQVLRFPKAQDTSEARV